MARRSSTATETTNDMAKVAEESFRALFGMNEKDVEEAGFDPASSAWKEKSSEGGGWDSDD